MDRPIPRSRLSAFSARAGIAASIWAVLLEGRWEGAAAGLPLVLAAVFLGFRLSPPQAHRLRAGAAARALAWFLAQSVAAGFDVAVRALRPRMPIDPAFVVLRTRLQAPGARVLLANGLTLMPGTLCAELRGDRIELHVLDRQGPIERQVREMEARIAEAYGESPAQVA